MKKIKKDSLNKRQVETYNFQKVSAVLADYGFFTSRHHDDWEGADFTARHINGRTFMNVQLKGRLTFAKKYRNKDIHICFPYKDDWYLFEHDKLLLIFSSNSMVY